MTTFPVLLSQWEPQPGAQVWIQADGDLIPVRLERDPVTQAPLLWRATVGTETFACATHRWWAPRLTDFPL